MDTPLLVSPLHFAEEMEAHWIRLDNTPSDSLRDLWRTMGSAFGKAIISFDKTTVFDPVPTWTVLNPPTGTGKSQGTCVYASMVARGNRRRSSKVAPVGVLIVTREITEADGLAAQINELAGFPCAVARHSESKLTRDEVHAADVLVVTHAAYVMALENFTVGSRWRDMIEWEGGRRRLTVIDETLSNVVEGHSIKSEDIRQVLAYVNAEMKVEFAPQVAALQEIEKVLDRIALAVKGNPDLSSQKVVWRGVEDGRVEFPESLSMGPLRERMKTLRYDLLTMHRVSPLDQQRKARLVDETLAAVESIMSRWAYYARKGNDHSLNSSRLLIPEDLPAPVVLDATASQQMLWGLMEDRAVVQPIPQGTRRYRNVTLHVARARSIGKTKMKETARARLPRILGDLQERIGRDRKVFLCCHKSIKHVAVGFAPEFARYGVGTWGAVDGKNDWKDCDTAVIVGLPYKDSVWSTNMFFATQGLQSNAWMDNPTWKQHTNVHTEMQRSQITVEVVQAINRVRCRKVIDAEGNCPETDVFVILPSDKVGDAVLENLKVEMPGLRVTEWDFQLDGANATQIRKGSSHDALLAYMENRLPGETAMTALQKELGLSSKSKANLMETLRDPAHPLTVRLKELGVEYKATGKGRGARAYLIKAD